MSRPGSIHVSADNQIDVTQIDEAEVDGDFLAVGVSGAGVGTEAPLSHPFSIHMDGIKVYPEQDIKRRQAEIRGWATSGPNMVIAGLIVRPPRPSVAGRKSPAG